MLPFITQNYFICFVVQLWLEFLLFTRDPGCWWRRCFFVFVFVFVCVFIHLPRFSIEWNEFNFCYCSCSSCSCSSCCCCCFYNIFWFGFSFFCFCRLVRLNVHSVIKIFCVCVCVFIFCGSLYIIMANNFFRFSIFCCFFSVLFCCCCCMCVCRKEQCSSKFRLMRVFLFLHKPVNVAVSLVGVFKPQVTQ